MKIRQHKFKGIRNNYKKVNGYVLIEKKSKMTNLWETVMLARSHDRPTSVDYINRLFPDFYELCGDQVMRDDHAIVAGVATFHGCPVTVIGQQKGRIR